MGKKLNLSKNIALGLATCLFSSTVIAQEPKTLKPEEPFVLQARKLQSYEVASGTFISLVILSANEFLPVAQVTQNIYDFYGNIAIPGGSRMVGKYIEKRANRHVVEWNGLQIPTIAGTLQINPPLIATMPDGSSGLTEYELGGKTGAITNESFIVPH